MVRPIGIGQGLMGRLYYTTLLQVMPPEMVRPIGVGKSLMGRLDDTDRLRLGGAAEGTVTQTSSMLRKKAIAQYSKDQAAKRLHELKVGHPPPPTRTHIHTQTHCPVF
jgi:hypothetical protein